MAAHSSVPVVNALTDEFHPCQILADLLTIKEHKGTLAGLTFAYVGDGANNMSHSYLLGMAMSGLHVRIGTPADYQPHPAVLARAARDRRRDGRLGDDRRGPGRGRRGRRRRRDRHLGLDGLREGEGVASGLDEPVRPLRGERRAHGPGRRRTRSSCTACPPTAASRSTPRSSTAPSRSSGTSPRTGCTRRRPCCRGSSRSRGAAADDRSPPAAPRASSASSSILSSRAVRSQTELLGILGGRRHRRHPGDPVARPRRRRRREGPGRQEPRVCRARRGR